MGQCVDATGIIQALESNQTIIVRGNKSAADAGRDIALQPSTTRTAGDIVRVENPGGTTVANFTLLGGLSLGTPAATPAAGTAVLYMSGGLPSNSFGANGDFCFRYDTPGTANQRLYVKSVGAWVGIV